MRTTAVSTRPPSLRDLGTLVTVQYPDRPDLALIAALRLLAISGASAEVRAVYVRGALLTRRTRNSLRPAPTVDAARAAHDREILLVGDDAPAIVIVGPDSILDVTSTYHLAELDLPPRLLCGTHARSQTSSDHTLADYPFGLTGVYLMQRHDTPLAAAYRLLSRLGPLARRRLDFDLQHLEASWRQLQDTA